MTCAQNEVRRDAFGSIFLPVQSVQIRDVSGYIADKLAKRRKDDYRVRMLLSIALGPAEIGIIVLIVLLIFGPSKLPQLGASVGKMLKGFKREMKSIDDDNDDVENPAGEIDVTPSEEKSS